MTEQDAPTKLTTKQSAFIDAYLANGFNATKAAVAAGYSKETAAPQASRLLTIVKVKEEIARRMAEHAMPADEVLARLAAIARGSIEAFVKTDDDGKPDGFSLSTDRPLHLVKKVTVTDKGWSFEMHDAHAALRDIGRHHSLFTDKISVDITPEKAAKLSDAELEAALKAKGLL